MTAKNAESLKKEILEMNVIVCIKQVPGTNNVEIDEVTGSLKRDGVESKMNPYDLFAVETGLRLRGSGTLTALSMGPRQAESALREAFMMGVDEAVLISDRAFAGADVLSTAYTLSQGVRAIGDFDVIVCGKQTTDGDTAQVGPELAEWLGLPQATNVEAILDSDETSITVRVNAGERIETLEVELPCLITVERDIYPARLPSWKLKRAGDDKAVRVMGLADMIDVDSTHYGLDGSATSVQRIFAPGAGEGRTLLKGGVSELVGEIHATLKRDGFV